MTLTLKEIYERYSVRDFVRIIEIKRRKIDGTSYEENWQNIEELSGLKLLDNSVQNISYKLSNNSYNFGIVNVANAKILLNSKNGQFDDEINSSSIFNKGFIRHKSLIRIREGYIDKYSNPANPVNILNTVFTGFIDDTSNSTAVDKDNLLQSFQCIDLLSFLLKEYTIADLGNVTRNNLNDLIYEILNRNQFTNFFTVDSNNINAGYNIANFDINQYQGQTTLFSLFENFSIGHSFFYVKNEQFYYQNIDNNNGSILTIDKSKLIEFANYNNGIQNTL